MRPLAACQSVRPITTLLSGRPVYRSIASHEIPQMFPASRATSGCASAYSVPKASDDFPEPEIPVNAAMAFRGDVDVDVVEVVLVGAADTHEAVGRVRRHVHPQSVALCVPNDKYREADGSVFRRTGELRRSVRCRCTDRRSSGGRDPRRCRGGPTRCRPYRRGREP